MHSVFIGLEAFVSITIEVIMGSLLGIFSGRKISVLPGVKIGTVTTTFHLAEDRPILMYAFKKAGTYLPLVMGLSRHEIVDYYDREILRSLTGLFFCTFILAMYRRTFTSLWGKVKRWFKREVIAPVIDFRPFDPVVENDDLQCIICYNRCRNLVFPNCKHLVICDQCKFNHRD